MSQLPLASRESLARVLDEANRYELPPPDLAATIAEHYLEIGDSAEAFRWATTVPSLEEDYASWHRARRVAEEALAGGHERETRRALRLAVLGSYTTNQLVSMIELVAWSRGIELEVYESGFNQYQQEILDSESGMYAFGPEIVLLAVEEKAVQLPQWSDSPADAIAEETGRWQTLWTAIEERSGASVVQTNFVPPVDDAFGHIGGRLPGSRSMMLRELNIALGVAAGHSVGIVDCQRLAATAGAARWFDERYWFLAKQGVSLESLPLLGKHVVAVISGLVGLARKCLVLDLDGTLWGGVIGDDGMEGIALGYGPAGEAFVAFQEYVLALKERGVILAICSKNDRERALEPFEGHTDMRLKASDFAIIVANWDPKPRNIEHIARMLDIGTDAIVFVDDQPAERAAVRRALPEVDVIRLPTDPSGYVPALGSYPFFEVGTLTDEDRARTDQYRSRAQAKEAESAAESMEDFVASLDMKARVAELDSLHIPRVSQLVGKTNQFNLTTRRHSRSALESMAADPDYDVFYLKLRDRFTDHGLVGVCITRQEDADTLVIDTLLMSCRVISRTAEATILDHVVLLARERGCQRVVGTFIPSGRNEIAREAYVRFGFSLISGRPESESTWELAVPDAPGPNPFIDVS